ncbi:MAG: thiamine phosphate synthase [Myxococcaceae bacterium]|nr:thiamine phosphate synthase [Myxococcaceae bacterium]
MTNKLPRGLYALYDDSFPLAVVEVARAGALTVQLRLKNTSDRDALALAQELKAHVPVLVLNDRVDLALLAGCGVHVGENDLPVREARRVLGPGALVGATCRTLDDVERAARDGADYAGVGPVFKSRLKTLGVPLLGAAGLAAICEKSPLPIVAISGIDETNLDVVAKAGAHAAAVSSAIFGRSQPARAAAMMLSQWGR